MASVLVPAFEAYSKRITEDRYRAVLARGGRTVEDWHQRLDRLAKEEGDPYRSITLQTDALWRIAEDPSTPADCRAAAAVVLRAKQGEEASARLQNVARSLASDNLAKALTGAAEAEEEADYVEVLELASDQQNAIRRA